MFVQSLTQFMTFPQLQKIREKNIGIIGAGGLGSNCANHLVRSGFMHFIIADDDVVEPSNLNRQFYFLDQVGQKKVLALQANLQRINPEVSITPLIQKITKENCLSLFQTCDIVIEAVDHAALKVELAKIFHQQSLLYITASGMAGTGDTDKIQTRKISNKFYIIGDMGKDVSLENPPFSPKVGIVAAKEADVVLHYVLEESDEWVY